MSESVETIVIGAGVIGLACAKSLAESGREVVVLERADGIGTETSSRNSEVIHAGIYYPAGSAKAKTCVEGRRALYAYCEERGIPHRKCGKLIVACSEDEEPVLYGILEKSLANGLTGPGERLEWRTADEAMALEPALFCTKALYSPSTGIVDSHALMLAYQGDAESLGAMIAFETPIEGGCILEDGFEVHAGGMALKARELVIAAGLHTQTVLRTLTGISDNQVPGQFYCKGNYFISRRRSPFQRLIYPVPQKSGLGHHVTIDLGGGLRFGPDTEWLDGYSDDPELYEVDPSRGPAFAESVRRFFPGLEPEDLIPGYAGIRPKLSRDGRVGDDFQMDGPKVLGIPGLVALSGMESPGLTASLAVGAAVLDLLSPKSA